MFGMPRIVLPCTEIGRSPAQASLPGVEARRFVHHSAMPATPAERRELRKGCALVVPDFATGSAADDFRALADWCEANRVEHDMYGQGELVEGFERKIAALLGKAAAMFAPSGVMAQLAAVKIWAEQRASTASACIPPRTWRTTKSRPMPR